VNFRQVGEDVYTCVAPPGYEKDPAVTAAIHSFDPGVIPFWRIQRWLLDGGEQTVVHHGIGRHYPYPKHLRRHFHVEMPAGADFPAPNFLDAVFEDQTALQYLRGGWGLYQPWDWSVYYWCREKFETLTVKAYDERVERHLARIMAILRAHREEIAYRKKQIEPWIERQLARVSPYDWKQLVAAQHRNAVARRLGLPPEKLRDPKVWVGLASAKPVRALWSPQSAETYGRVAPSQGVRS
jgi:hypothetical protein